jgi:RNA recognition motif-containing protein
MDNNKLYVGNLDYGITSNDLIDYFSSAGTVISAKVISDRDTGRSKGFGFVEMQSPEDAQNAIDELDGSEFHNRKIKVNKARPQ